MVEQTNFFLFGNRMMVICMMIYLFLVLFGNSMTVLFRGTILSYMDESFKEAKYQH